MQANTIPGTAKVVQGNIQVAIAIVNLKIFQEYSRTVVDMAEQRRLWIVKNRDK